MFVIVIITLNVIEYLCSRHCSVKLAHNNISNYQADPVRWVIVTLFIDGEAVMSHYELFL